ncbi:MAG: hypothetical protein ACI9OJ_000882 [Myxococcota bacterium]|jgi:hypothetical protein
MWVLHLLVFPVLSWCLPGYLASRWLFGRSTPLERVATTYFFGNILVVPFTYIIPYVTRQPITTGWILGTGLVLAAIFAALLKFKPRHDSPPPTGETSAQGKLVALVVIGISVLVAMTTRPTHSIATQLWLPCPHQASLFLLEDGRGNGLDGYDSDWDQWVSHVTEHPVEPGYGIAKILRTQRIGSAATLVQHMGSLTGGGLVVATFSYTFLMTAFGTLLFTRFVRNRWAAAIFAIIWTFGTQFISFYMVNESALAAGLGFGTLYLILRDRQMMTTIFAGAGLALTVATRPICLTYVLPAFLLSGPGLKRRLVLIAVMFIMAAPWMLTNYESFGNAFEHPSLIHVATDHEFLGMTIRFHPLNWPISDTLTRPAHTPYPNMFLVPLEHIQAFGALFWVLVFVGIFTVGWRLGIPLFLWSLPVYAMLLLVVTLDSEKLSYGLLGLAPAAILAGRGLQALLGGELDLTRKIIISVASFVLLVDMPSTTLPATALPVDNRIQYLNGAERFDGMAEDDIKAALGDPVLLPGWDLDEASFALPRCTGLLTHARPARRDSNVLQSPMMAWIQFVPYDRTYTIDMSDEPHLHPAIATIGDGFRDAERAMVVSLALRDNDGQVQVRISRAEGDLEIHVTTDASSTESPERYLSVHMFENSGPDYASARVFVDERELSPNYFVLERGSERQRLLRVIANHPLHFSPTDSGFDFQVETWPTVPCGAELVSGVVGGPGVYLDTRGRKPARIFKSASYPPQRAPACQPTQTTSQSSARGP